MTAGSNERASVKPRPAEPVVDLEERNWLARHRRGEAEAFPALLAAYRRPVYAYLVRAGVGEADRDDLFQTIFLRVHRAAGDYQPSRPLAPWLFTIAANTVRNHFRDSTGAEVRSIEGQDSALADPGPDPERAAAARLTLDWLEAAIQALPAIRRHVLLLICVVGLSQAEVAAALELPVNSVKTHLRRARLRLARERALRERESEPMGEGDEHL